MREKIASTVAIFMSGLASICCVGPIVLVSLGLGGAGLAAGLTAYRPYFLGVTAFFLGLSFYLVYRKRQVACADGPCEMRSGSKRMKAGTWLIAAAVVGMATFPNWSPLLIRGGPAGPVSAHAQKVVLSVSGMTCTACAASIEKSLKKLPGVEGASVNFDASEAVVYVEPDRITTSALLEAIQAAGAYTAQVKEAG